MGNPDKSNMCENAELYYYDYAFGKIDDIPVDVADHIANCDHCQQEVEWLKQTASKAEQDTDTKASLALQISNMELHLSLTNEAVTCSKIKALLPIMAIPETDIRIPTPVTSHIKKCSACAQDLSDLKGFGLTQEQLVLICKNFSNKSCCDLKGYVEMSQFYDAICRIQDRPDSKVITRFDVDETADGNSDMSATVAVDKSGQVAKPFSSIDFGIFLKPLAAAAVFVIGYVLIFNSNSVKATSLEQVYDALKNVKNILMANYGPDSETPGQEIWISKTLEAKLLKNRDEFALWDVSKGVKYTGKASSSEILTTKVESDLIEAARKTMNVPWGLLPFNNPTKLPAGAVWEEVVSEGIDEVASDIKVYELSWTQYAIGGKPINYKRKYYIDEKTKRPNRIEVLKERQLPGQYELTNIIEISYPSDEQMQTTLKQHGL